MFGRVFLQPHIKIKNNKMEKIIKIKAEGLTEKLRVDVFITKHSELSRAQVQRFIEYGKVSINGQRVYSPAAKVANGTLVEFIEALPVEYTLKHQDIPLTILHEDPNFVIVNKQPGLVCHPAPGHYDGTLVNALLGKYLKEEDFQGGGVRLGIVHRLDMDTSGVMVVARNMKTHQYMTEQFSSRLVQKKYLCIVHGGLEENGYIGTYIARDLHDRKKYTARTMSGKEAQTEFEPVEKFLNATLLGVKIFTGRTHQIRVHMNYIKHPVVGDTTYGDKNRDLQLLESLNYSKEGYSPVIPRQMLHAHTLEFVHPITAKRVFFKAEPPADFNRLLKLLRKK